MKPREIAGFQYLRPTVDDQAGTRWGGKDLKGLKDLNDIPEQNF